MSEKLLLVSHDFKANLYHLQRLMAVLVFILTLNDKVKSIHFSVLSLFTDQFAFNVDSCDIFSINKATISSSPFPVAM